ncbi:MAG: carboxypeptidase regulatory-like domain-containing protein [Chloracidobacterium sp.]|nr:carboxypeptidase regulatory-like domain-containing protein [Chloracidobacterium sp.]
MSNNQRSSSFLAIRFLLAALIAVVFITGSTIGTGASIAPLGDKKGDREIAKGVKSEAPTAAFTPGNIVVSRVGDGAATLGTAAAPVSLVEFTSAGANTNTVPMPTAAANGGGFTDQGSSSSNGHLNLSLDGRYLTLLGYDAPAGTLAVNGLTSAVANRNIARVDASGTVTIVARLTDAHSASNSRAAVTDTGVTYYTAGAGTPGTTNGVRYVDPATSTTTSVQINSLNNRNVVMAKDAANNKFLLAASQVTLGFWSPLPTATTAPTASGIIPADAEAMVFLDRVPAVGATGLGGLDTAFIADNATGLKKFEWDTGTSAWVARGVVAGTFFGVAARVAGANIELFVTTSGGTSNNNLQAITDTSAFGTSITATPTTIASAGANFSFRGVAFSPGTTTAAGVFVSGRVMTSEGRGITNAVVTITGNALAEPRTVVTGRRGTYMFDDLEPGATYIVTVRSRRFMFSNPSQVISIVDNVSDADFIADGGTSRSR